MLIYTQPIAVIELLNEDDIVRTSTLTASDLVGDPMTGSWKTSN